MIYVVVTIELVEDKRSLYLEELEKIIPMVRSEAGCLEYGPAEDLPVEMISTKPINKNLVTVIERWSDVDAVKMHLASSHMQRYLETTKHLIKSQDIRVLKPL